ncbi:uncharacterized protein LOC123399969 [Hordeum vulgare subsp. vulgare]|uniref:uncharacterized protein LOC123399969 n=1 Tax=Hordeum vulgare subsp. vulgare TaxID=112509 RepID=UPI001D1A3A05|nr:uncharacterized protein LOC123399969 [Hordeum vulgare subsp. vulgare]
MAMRILNLTTSSSGCERNWSVFEQVDAKRRNKLDVSRRDDLVYVQLNGRMLHKRKKYSTSSDVLLGEDASTSQDWIREDAYVDDEMEETEDDNAMEPRRSLRVRELHEVEKFVSDDEIDTVPINEDDTEFECDDDGAGIEETNDNGEEDHMQP